MGEEMNYEETMADELWAWTLAQDILRYAREANVETAAHQVECEALRILTKIKEILDDTTLDDPECFYRIDSIVNEFFQLGGLSIRHHQEYE